MSTNVGEIYYEVSADVAALLDAQQQAEDALDSMQNSFDSTSNASENLDSGLNKLAATIKGVIAAAALREAADMVQKYQEMAERVQMATASQSEFEMVQKRLLNTANGTYRALGEAQELYIRTADSLRSMGYVTTQAMDVQDSMSYAFVKNATSADRAGAAIDAFSKSINTGKVAADQWETLTTAIPSVINDIAAASGQSAAAIRALGAAGQLTARQLTEGLRQSLEENTAAAAGMSNNLTDATVRLRTAVTSILVAFENETGALQEFTNGLIKSAGWMLEFGNNAEQMKGVIDAASSAAIVFAGVMGARYVGALAMATTAKLQSIAASRQQAAADVQAAQNVQIATTALVRKTLADKEAALSALNLAQAEYNVARGSAAETFALNNLIAAKTAARNASLSLAQAEIAQATAQNTAAAAARNASVAVGMARGALALVGGPAGAAMLAGAAIFYFYQKAQQARQESIEFADSLNGVLAKMKEMNSTQLAANIAKAEQSMIDQREAISDLTREYDELAQRKTFIEQAAQIRGAAAVAEDYANINRDLAIQAGKVDAAENRLSQTVSSVGILRAQLNGTLLQGIDLLRRDGEAAGVAAGMMSNLGKMLNFATAEKEKFNSSSIKIERPKGVQDYLDKLSAQVELQGELNERKRAQLKAEQEIRQLGGNENDVRLARERAAAEFDSVDAQRAQKKAADQAASSGKQAATQAESVAQKLANLRAQSDLTTESVEKRRIQEAGLRAEQSLGSAATQQQLAEARALGEANEKAAISIQKRKEAEQGQKYAKQEIAAGNTSVNPITGASVDPLAQINLQETQKLEAIAKYQELDKQNTQLYEDAKTAIQLQASNARMQIAQTEADQQRASVLSILGSASQGFDSLASIIADSAGKSNAAYQVMFAASKAFAIAQSTLSLNTAIMQAMADPTALTPAQKLANYAAIASAGASLLSNVASISYGGGREHGGPVSASSMYRVGEGGKPEIFKASNGSQYMIPGDNGRVISNRDMQGSGSVGGSVVQHITFEINTTGGIDDATMAKMSQMMKQVSLNTIRDQQRPNGLLRR